MTASERFLAEYERRLAELNATPRPTTIRDVIRAAALAAGCTEDEARRYIAERWA